jgi:hypothetical protein
VLKFVIPGVLGLALLILSWMSLLRVDNMAHDVAVLRQDVDTLKQQMAAHGAGNPAAPPATAPPFAAPLPAVSESPAAAPAALPGPAYEAVPQRFFSSSFSGPQSIVLPLPQGTTFRAAQIVVVAVEGEGAAPVTLPAPQPSANLEPGTPQAMTGLCQGPDGAAWVFTLEGNSIRLESRGCQYPVRGLRPHLRISVTR